MVDDVENILDVIFLPGEGLLPWLSDLLILRNSRPGPS